MIFVIVGTQLAFDRLIAIIDTWAGSQGDIQVFAQIANSRRFPKNIQWQQFLDSQAFTEKIEEADLIISHAGMGAVLSALQKGKKIIVFPRRRDLGELVNDHQLATARWLENKKLGVYIAYDDKQLLSYLKDYHILKSAKKIDKFAPPELINNLRSFISGKD